MSYQNEVTPPQRRSDKVRRRRARLEVSPRLLGTVVLLIVAAAAIALVVILLQQRGEGGVTLVGPPTESTATVTLAGVFPAEDDAPLAKPLAIATEGERLYVAEAGNGTIGVFRLNGARVSTLTLPPAVDAVTTYPSDIAVIDEDRIVVVDNAAPRVIALATDPDARQPIMMTFGEDQQLQPTAVTYADGEIFVADGNSHTVLVFSAEDGALLRSLGTQLEPALSFVGGMSIGGSGALYVSDSNNARIVVLDPDSGGQVAVFPEALKLPKALTKGPGTSIFAVDTFASSVLLTDASGAVIESIAEGEGYRLDEPRGVVWIDSDRRVYITDACIGRVVVLNVRTER